MPDRLFNVICTDPGCHGRIDWPTLALADDEAITEERTRRAPLAPGSGPTRAAIVPAEGHRGANGTWRWRWPRCGRDRPLTENHLRAWMSATSGSDLDISLLPR